MNLLRKIEVQVANGKRTLQAARRVGMTEQTYVLPLAEGIWGAEAGPGEAAGGWIFFGEAGSG